MSALVYGWVQSGALAVHGDTLVLVWSMPW